MGQHVWQGILMVLLLLGNVAANGPSVTLPLGPNVLGPRGQLLVRPPLNYPGPDNSVGMPKANSPVVRVNFNRVVGNFDPKKLGGARSEERENWAQIYDPKRTLRPLSLVTNRFQLALGDEELGPDGSFLDSKGSQCGILRKVSQSVSSDVLVTVGFPHSAKAKQYISGGFSDPSWVQFWQNTFTTLAATLAGRCWTGKQIWIELFSEYDFFIWNYIYGDSVDRKFFILKMAYDAFNPYRPSGKFRIGGSGFSFPEGWWGPDGDFVSRQLDFMKANGIAFDFFSTHVYLNWADQTNPAGFPFPGEYWSNAYFSDPSRRTQIFKDILEKAGSGGVPIVISEYAWQDADWEAAAGCKNDERSARVTLTHHQSCARTLQALEIAASDPNIQRVYWAQITGGIWDWTAALDCHYGWAYDTAVTYMRDRREWNYKAAYYALWIYGQMGRRLEAQWSDPRLGVWASRGPDFVRVAIWNRDKNGPRSAWLELPGVGPNWMCSMHLVDRGTFQLNSSDPLYAVVAGPYCRAKQPIRECTRVREPPRVASVATVAQALSWLQRRRLQAEATAYLDIVLP